jgi:hypothetical protein
MIGSLRVDGQPASSRSPATSADILLRRRPPNLDTGLTRHPAPPPPRCRGQKGVPRFGLGRRACSLVAILASAASSLCAQQPILPPNHQGFPLTFNGKGTVLISQPVMADLGLTPGFNQIIFGTRQGDLYVLQRNSSDGSWGVAPGWPVNLGAHIGSSPAIADLDGDGVPDIVVGYGSNFDANPKPDGGVKAFHRDGTLMWSVVTGPLNDGSNNWTHAPVFGTPAIGDVDGDGKLEVVFGSFDHHLYVVDAKTGANKPNWPVDVLDTVYSSPALYDIDGDGRPDIIIGTDNYLGCSSCTPAVLPGGKLEVRRFDGTSVTGFPKYIDQTINGGPVVADLDGDGKPEIIHGTGSFYPNRAHQVYAWHCDGSPVAGWPVAVDGQVGTTPAIADLNGDGHLEVIVTDDNTGSSNTFHVYVFKGDGSLLWSARPIDFNGNTLSAGEPVIGDVLGDSHLEVLVPTNSEVTAFDHTGAQLTQGGPPYTNQKVSFNTGTSLSNVFVGDLEINHADGKIEVLAISANDFPTANNLTVYVWNPVSSDNAPPWGMYRHSIDRIAVAPGAGSCRGACVTDSTASSYFTLAPCRVVDTRQSNGTWGSPSLTNGVFRDFVMTGQCGIPSGARAISANVTVVNGTGGGDLRFSPGCQPPPTSTINFDPGQTRANNAVFALDSLGRVTVDPVVTGFGTVDLLIDINGYFK